LDDKSHTKVDADNFTVFRKTVKRRAYEDVVDQIERAILRGELKKQERLPSERDLIVQFGVSRATIREALRVLQSRGLIEVRHGDPGGPIVRADPGASVTSVLSSLFHAERLSLADVIQFRMIVESAAAGFAATASKEAISAIREAYHRMEKTTTLEEQFQCDVLFHRRIAEAGSNPLFALVVDALHQFNSIATWQSKRPLDKARRDTLAVHGLILDAIEAGDSERAAELSRHHLAKSYEPIIGPIDRQRLERIVPKWK
jgi:DNA-binding FadR family transcriptional regulator